MTSTAARRIPRRWAVIALAVLLLGAGMTAIALRPGSSPTEQTGRQNSPPGPVLLVPPYGGGTKSLEILAGRLRAAGREAIVVPVAGDGTGDLRAQAQLLNDTATKAIAAGAASVDAVGYSAGGVVARIWVAQLDGARQARRVITLGSPHNGTQLSSIAGMLLPDACPLGCRQLAPDSEILRDLPQAPEGPTWTSIWTQEDVVVTPPESAKITGGVNVRLQSVCTDSKVEHGGLPTDPLTTGLVLTALGPTPLTSTPSTEVCAALRAQGS